MITIRPYSRPHLISYLFHLPPVVCWPSCCMVCILYTWWPSSSPAGTRSDSTTCCLDTTSSIRLVLNHQLIVSSTLPLLLQRTADLSSCQSHTGPCRTDKRRHSLQLARRSSPVCHGRRQHTAAYGSYMNSHKSSQRV